VHGCPVALPKTRSYGGVTFGEKLRDENGLSAQRLKLFLFFRSLYPGSFALSVLIWIIYPRFFKRDFALLDLVGRCAARDEFYECVVMFYKVESEFEVDTWRERLNLRISGRRLLKIEASLFYPSPARKRWFQ
jgi:hypothetical protein